MTANRYSVTTGGPVTFTATLAGTGASGQTITFQRRQSGDSAWVTIGTAATGTGGTASFMYAPRFSATYQSVFAGSGSLKAATSDTDAIGVVSKIALSPGSKTVRRCTSITNTATVTPIGATGGTVSFLVNKNVKGTWVYQGASTVRLNSAGKASYARPWSSAYSFYVRARANDTLCTTRPRGRTSRR